MMVVVDGPTRGDEQAGRLLSGPAGELFDKMLGAMGLSRQQIYVTAMTRCTSGKPASEPPPKLAVESCAPFLAHELALVEPKVVVIMGEHASEKLLGKPLTRSPPGGQRPCWPTRAAKGRPGKTSKR